MVKPTSNSRETSRITLLIPLFRPVSRADRRRKLAQGFALVLVARLFRTDQPFVVTVPAMQGLIRSREPFIMRRGSNVLDKVQTSHLLLVQFGRFRRENLG